MAFHVGQKVVCVRSHAPNWRQVWAGTIETIKGQVYTVRGWENGPSQEGPGLLFEEIVNVRFGGVEPNYDPDRFRPVVERKTDTGMAILRKLLTTTKRKAPALASTP